MADRESHWRFLAWLALLGASSVPAAARAAAPAGVGADEQELIEDIKAREDPTILKSRAWIEGERNNDRHDAGSFELTLGARKGWRISPHHDWAVQVELPYKRTRASDAGGNHIEHGLGDIRLTIGTAVRLSKTWRIGGGLELRAPTAREELSANIWRIQEFAAVAWDATPWLTITPKLEYYQTIAKQRRAAPQHYMELNFPATFLLPDHWSVTPNYEAKLDFENHHTTHFGRFAIGKQLEDPQLGFALSFKVPINRSSNEYQWIFAVTNYF